MGKSILPLLLVAALACNWASVQTAKEESKDKPDVGTVIGIDLGK